MSKIISSTHAKKNFGELLEEAKKQPIKISRNGRNTAVILSVEEYEHLAFDGKEEVIRLAKTSKKDLVTMSLDDFNQQYGYLLD